MDTPLGTGTVMAAILRISKSVLTIPPHLHQPRQLTVNVLAPFIIDVGLFLTILRFFISFIFDGLDVPKSSNEIFHACSGPGSHHNKERNSYRKFPKSEVGTAETGERSWGSVGYERSEPPARTKARYQRIPRLDRWHQTRARDVGLEGIE